jgi:PilZ domain-containing protein
MGTRERRISPRKDCIVPLRFRVTKAAAQAAKGATGSLSAKTPFGTLEGESVNLSERGIYFRSRHSVSVGEPLEMYFTIPRELTGRGAEQVRCSARVVHVEPQADEQGLVGVGAAVERFEPMSGARDWGN